MGALNDLMQEVHQTAVDKGFWDDERNFGEMIALVHSELSEALEEHRSGTPTVYSEDGKPEGVAVELIDAMIRILDILGSLDVDIDEVFALKAAYNNTRPYKHGRNY